MQSKFFNNTNIGQNFLIDNSVIDFITRRAKITKDDTILEIGPGKGILTKGLLSFHPRKVYSIEYDERLKEFLAPVEAKHENIHIFWGDALAFDYKTLPSLPGKIIANLPYHITTPLIFTFLEQLAPLGTNYFLLMVQLEAGERLTATPHTKARSPLGITIEAMGEAKLLRRVAPESFKPRPAVTSAIVEITLSKRLDIANDMAWRRLLQMAFKQRRKTLQNNFLAGGYTREQIAALFEKLDLPPTVRAEELTLEEWLALRECID